LRWIIFTAGGVVGAVTLLVLAGPSIRSWQMERAIVRFERRPSQDRADSLLELLHLHAGTDEQGRRALTLLLRPNIVTRKAYATGQPITIATEPPFKLGFPRFFWKETRITINGQPTTWHHNSGSLARGTTCLNVPGFYTQAGTYPIELRIQCTLGIERVSRTMMVLDYLNAAVSRLIPEPAMRQPRRTYECDFTTSSEVIVLEEDEAEKIELTSSPELDQAMRAAFSARYVQIETTFATLAGRRWVSGSSDVSYQSLPVAAAFSMALRLPDGREIPVQATLPRALLARAGSSGNFTVDPSSFIVETPGRYQATLVLVPDPNLAYRDPTITAIWNGTLEFPVSFFIDANAPSR
jgi:hypothetical protein